MALDTPVNRFKLMSVFPDLAKDVNFKILSECNPIYNCIAWVMGYDDRWVDHYNVAGHWWPNGVSRDSSPDSLIAAFQAEGFELSDNIIPEDGYSKVILYKNPANNEWTHAARVISKDVEYSKFGQSWDGQHSHDVLCNTGKGYEDSTYGIAYACMKRVKNNGGSGSVLHGTISVDLNNLAKLRAILGK